MIRTNPGGGTSILAASLFCASLHNPHPNEVLLWRRRSDLESPLLLQVHNALRGQSVISVVNKLGVTGLRDLRNLASLGPVTRTSSMHALDETRINTYML
eukprot:6248778-Amphidinium_carterae.1